MSDRPDPPSRFEFVVTAGARARQLLAGCTPRIDAGDHKKTTTARREVAARVVQALPQGAPGTSVDPTATSERPV